MCTRDPSFYYTNSLFRFLFHFMFLNNAQISRSSSGKKGNLSPPCCPRNVWATGAVAPAAPVAAAPLPQSSIFSDNPLASLFSTERKYPRDPKFVGFHTTGHASSLLCLLLWHHNKQGGIHLVMQNFQTIYHPPPFCTQLYDFCCPLPPEK